MKYLPLFDGHPLSKKPSTPKMSLGIAYMKYVSVFAVFCAHTISSHQVMVCFSRTFTFVENDEQTHKLVFCHSKEVRSFTTRNALSVNMKKEVVFDCVFRDRAEGGAGGALAPPLLCKKKNKLNKK